MLDFVLYLSLTQLQHLGQTLPFRRGQVFLGLEHLLQLDGLIIRKADLAALSLVQWSLDVGGPQQRLPYKAGANIFLIQNLKLFRGCTRHDNPAAVANLILLQPADFFAYFSWLWFSLILRLSVEEGRDSKDYGQISASCASCSAV